MRDDAEIELYRGTSLIRNSAPLGFYSRTMPRVLWQSCGVGTLLLAQSPVRGERGEFDELMAFGQGRGLRIRSIDTVE